MTKESQLILILINNFTEALPDDLDAFKNFQNTTPSTRNLNFWFISIGSDFSKSETVLGHILQSAFAALNHTISLVISIYLF